MISAPFAFILACLAGPSLALSCVQPEVATTFNEAAASEKTYILVHGNLTFDEVELPEADLNHQDQTPPHVNIKAQLKGKSLSKDGFKTEFDRIITLRVLCYGPWCGRAVSGEEYLSFLERIDGGLVLSITPCGGYDFAEPSDEMLDQVSQCIKNGMCDP